MVRKLPAITAATVQGRPMANLGLKRLNKKLRQQVKNHLKRGGFDLPLMYKLSHCLSYLSATV